MHSHSTFFCLLFLSLSSGAVYGCASSSDSATVTAAPSPEASAHSATTIQFETPGTITLAASEVRQLVVHVQPPSVHSLRFSLLGNSLDASLDADERQTDETGTGIVELRAASKSATFLVRATADDGPFAEAPISVSSQGFASLRVIPSYAGLRQVQTWTASATSSETCSRLPGLPPPDGPIVASSSQDAPVLLTALPANTKLAITLRSGSSLGGCLDLPPLTAGETRTIAVTLNERPADISALSMNVTAHCTDATTLSQFAISLTNDFLQTFIPKESSEASALLDAMADHSPDPTDFQNTRKNATWDSALSSFLVDGHSPRLLLQTWAHEGQQELQQGLAFTAQLSTNQQPVPQSVLTNISIAASVPGAKGLPGDAAASLYVDPGDIVHLGSAFYFLPSRLVASAIGKTALSAEGYLIDPSEALRAQLSCKAVTEVFSQLGPLPTTCDDVCIETACARALEQFWQRACDSSAVAGTIASMSFSVSAHGTLNDKAKLVSLTGPWVGSVTLGDVELALSGALVLQEN